MRFRGVETHQKVSQSRPKNNTGWSSSKLISRIRTGNCRFNSIWIKCTVQGLRDQKVPSWDDPKALARSSLFEIVFKELWSDIMYGDPKERNLYGRRHTVC
nr:hypothetical protein [Rhizoctonia sp.]